MSSSPTVFQNGTLVVGVSLAYSWQSRLYESSGTMSRSGLFQVNVQAVLSGAAIQPMAAKTQGFWDANMSLFVINPVDCSGFSNSRTNDMGNDCVQCQAGKEPLSDHSACQSCAVGGYFSAAGSACTLCGPGSMASEDRSSCVACVEFNDSFWYSENSTDCQRCGAGYQPNPTRTACDICLGQFSANGRQCLDCPVGSQPTLASAATNCTPCNTFGPQYVSSASGLCSACGIGTEPRADHGACQPCSPGWVSFGSVCTPCAAGTTAAMGQCVSCRTFDHDTSKFYSYDNSPCAPCWANAEPLTDFNRTACNCKPGYHRNGYHSCTDIDECAINSGISDAGTCNSTSATSTCYNYDVATSPLEQASCGCCHAYSSGCVNTEGSFQCLPCLAGFVGSSYGALGCALPVVVVDANTVVGCNGILVVQGGQTQDACGICGGDNSTCLDCFGTPVSDSRPTV
jgi:hypothetical protein